MSACYPCSMLTFNQKTIKAVGGKSLLSISWELVTHCQFACSYCYFHPYESDIQYKEVMKLVLLKLKKINEPFEITLLGGEPTLHPEFHQIVKELYEIENVVKIEVISNFQPTVEFWEPLKPYSKKLDLILSYHVEYAQNLFFKKIQSLKNHFQMMIIFLVHHEEKYLAKMREASDYYFSLDLEFIPITFARLVDRDDQVKYYPYTETTLAFMGELEKKVLALKNPEMVKVEYADGQRDEINQLTFGNLNLNRFKGWKCQMNSLIIHPDGVVMYPCTGEKKHILFAELKGRQIKCPLDFCGCEAYWRFEKVSN